MPLALRSVHTSGMNRAGLAITAALLSAATQAHADPGDPGSRETPFDRGHFTLMAGGGSQTVGGNHYLGVGVGVGYYVLDGLELGLFALHEFGSGPSLNEVTPSIQYVARPLVGRSPLIPYAGVFYNHWFVGAPLSDSDTAGTRAGAVYLSGRVIVGLGVVYEHVLSTCTQSCDQVYPDVTLGFSL
jgi:hypothetical protein